MKSGLSQISPGRSRFKTFSSSMSSPSWPLGFEWSNQLVQRPRSMHAGGKSFERISPAGQMNRIWGWELTNRSSEEIEFRQTSSGRSLLMTSRSRDFGLDTGGNHSDHFPVSMNPSCVFVWAKASFHADRSSFTSASPHEIRGFVSETGK